VRPSWPVSVNFVTPTADGTETVTRPVVHGPATLVTWAMEGPVPYFAKIIHLFVDMDRMVGADFEAGLAAMKAAAEK